MRSRSISFVFVLLNVSPLEAFFFTTGYCSSTTCKFISSGITSHHTKSYQINKSSLTYDTSRSQKLQSSRISIADYNIDDDDVTDILSLDQGVAFRRSRSLPQVVSAADDEPSNDQDFSFTNNSLTQIISIALLITANTVGAGMIALPDTVSKPGMLNSIPLFLGIYVVNLASGLLIAEVCIKQQEDFVERGIGAEPTSFKAMAEESFGESLSTSISALSIFGNWCVLSFALTRAGATLNGILPGSSPALSSDLALYYAAFLILGTVILQKDLLSSIASSAGTLLFLSFLGIVIPGFTHVVSESTTGAISDSAFVGALTNSKDLSTSSFLTAAPTIVELMIYQNIVPTVTKLLGFSRSKTTVTLVVGSGIPMIMYISYCAVVVGGLVDKSPSIDNPIVTMFLMSSIVGSTISGAISLSSEFTSILEKSLPRAESVTNDVMSMSTNSDNTAQAINILGVFLSVAPPLAIGTLLGDSVSDALKTAGAYCAPFLYGVIPVALAWKQRKRDKELGDVDECVSKDMVPGGTTSLIGVWFCSVGLIGQTVVTDITHLFNGVSNAVLSFGVVI